jgi:hypothetical protein
MISVIRVAKTDSEIPSLPLAGITVGRKLVHRVTGRKNQASSLFSLRSVFMRAKAPPVDRTLCQHLVRTEVLHAACVCVSTLHLQQRAALQSPSSPLAPLGQLPFVIPFHFVAMMRAVAVALQPNVSAPLLAYNIIELCIQRAYSILND